MRSELLGLVSIGLTMAVLGTLKFTRLSGRLSSILIVNIFVLKTNYIKKKFADFMDKFRGFTKFENNRIL